MSINKKAFITVGPRMARLGQFAKQFAKPIGDAAVKNPFQAGMALSFPLSGLASAAVDKLDPTGGLIGSFIAPGTLVKTIKGATPVSKGGRGSARDIVAKRYKNYNPVMNRPFFNMTKQSSVHEDSMNIQDAARRRYYMEKVGSRRFIRSTVEAAKDLGPMAQQLLAYGTLGVGLGVGAPLAAYGVGTGMERIRRSRSERDYKKMIKEDPSLKGNAEAKKTFKVLHSIAPSISKNPAIAANTVSNLLELPMITPQTYNDILKLEKSLQDTSMPFLKAQGGAKSFGLPMKDLGAMSGE